MPTTSLEPVRSYLEPRVFERMETARSRMRKVSRSKFIEDAIVEKLERMERIPTHEGTRRKTTAV